MMEIQLTDYEYAWIKVSLENEIEETKKLLVQPEYAVYEKKLERLERLHNKLTK